MYDDSEFYVSLINEFLKSHGAADAVSLGAADETEGADGVQMTQEFLKRRELLGGQRRRVKKEIEKRVSKERRIKYIVHEQLVNFMTAEPDVELNAGRDQIIRGLFGQRRNESTKNGKVKKRRRHSSEGGEEGEIIRYI